MCCVSKLKYLVSSLFLTLVLTTGVAAEVDTFVDNTLVIYNSLATDSQEIAEYYASKRGIDPSQICPITIAPGQYANKAELLGARKTIIDTCICPLLGSSAPSDCSINNTAGIAAVSPFTHLAIIRGVPARLTGTGFQSDFEEPPFALYLSHLLYKSTEDIFGEGMNGQIGDYQYQDRLTANTFLSENKSIRGLKEGVSTAANKLAVYGRIEAITKERTFELIDRTLRAEADGFTGNIIDSGYGVLDVQRHFLMDLTDSRESQCEDYILNRSGSWPYESCRYGGTTNGKVPGDNYGGIVNPLNVGYYAGTNPWPNNQSGFNGSFEVMKNWHKSEKSCIELCADLPEEDQQLCRESSTDFFKELNTDCVGLAKGAIGHQVRSYPVQYYGFYPPGTTRLSIEGVPPVRINDALSSFQSSKYSDPYFIRFGGNGISDNGECVSEDSQTITCAERIPFNLYTKSSTTTVTAPEDVDIRFVVRYRNPENVSHARFFQRIYLHHPTERNCDRFFTKSVSVAVASPNWSESVFTVNDLAQGSIRSASNCSDTSEFSFTKVSAGVYAYLGNGIRNYIDFDAIELVNDRYGEDIYSVEYGSFNAPYINNLVSGDWAANWIDRLGGIGLWGSGSHFLTGGWAYSQSATTIGALFSGRSLGEAIYLAGNQSSGTIYADPLYSPSAAKLIVEDGEQYAYTPYIGEDIGEFNTYIHINPLYPDAGNVHLRANVLHGRGKTDRTTWKLERCIRDNPSHCEGDDWTFIDMKQEVGFGITPVSETIDELLADIEEEATFVTFRLQVFNPGEEENALYSYVHIRYEKNMVLEQFVENVEGRDASIRLRPILHEPGIEGGFRNIVDPFYYGHTLRSLRVKAASYEIASELEVSVFGIVGQEYNLHKVTTGDYVYLYFLDETSTRIIDYPERLLMTFSHPSIDNDGDDSFSIVVNILPGDINQDGVLDQVDVAIHEDYLAGDSRSSYSDFDYNNDHLTTQADVDILHQWILHGVRLPSLVTACSDGVDNDGDEGVDFPEDLDCTNSFDNSEEEVLHVELPASEGGSENNNEGNEQNGSEKGGIEEGSEEGSSRVESPPLRAPILDVDGDGFSDFLLRSSDVNITRIGTVSGAEDLSSEQGVENLKSTTLLPFNYKGKTEILRLERGKNSVTVKGLEQEFVLNKVSRKIVSGCDLNGDRSSELIFLKRNALFIYDMNNLGGSYRKVTIPKRYRNSVNIKDLVCSGNQEISLLLSKKKKKAKTTIVRTQIQAKSNTKQILKQLEKIKSDRITKLFTYQDDFQGQVQLGAVHTSLSGASTIYEVAGNVLHEKLGSLTPVSGVNFGVIVQDGKSIPVLQIIQENAQDLTLFSLKNNQIIPRSFFHELYGEFVARGISDAFVQQAITRLQ